MKLVLTVVSVALVAAVVAVLAALTETRLAPAPQPVATFGVILPEPVPTSTPAPTPVTREPSIPLVGGDALADPPEFPTLGKPLETTIAATFLGSPPAESGLGEVVVYAYETDAGSVCITIGNSEGAQGTCVTVETFRANGITVDRGGWSLAFTPDGQVVWSGS